MRSGSNPKHLTYEENKRNDQNYQQIRLEFILKIQKHLKNRSSLVSKKFQTT